MKSNVKSTQCLQKDRSDIFITTFHKRELEDYMKRLIQQKRIYHTYNFKTRNWIIYEFQLKYLVMNGGHGLHKINILMLQARLYIFYNPSTFNLYCFLKPLFHFWLFRVIYLSVCHLYVYSLSITVWIVYIQSQPSRTLKSLSSHSLFFWSLFSFFSNIWEICFLISPQN